MYKEINHEQNKQQQQQQITKPQTRNICYMFAPASDPLAPDHPLPEQTSSKYRFHSLCQFSMPLFPCHLPQRGLAVHPIENNTSVASPSSSVFFIVLIATWYSMSICLLIYYSSLYSLRAATLFCCHISQHSNNV